MPRFLIGRPIGVRVPFLDLPQSWTISEGVTAVTAKEAVGRILTPSNITAVLGPDPIFKVLLSNFRGKGAC